MSQQNVEIVLSAYEAFAQGDLTEVLAHFDPAVVSYTAPPLPDPVEHQRYEGFLEWVENWTGAFDEFAIYVEDHIDLGERIVLRVVQRATGATSGVPVEQTFWLLHVLRDGKITRIGIHASEGQALEAAGLRE
jgi:ketosteroid isomerase-like protein